MPNRQRKLLLFRDPAFGFGSRGGFFGSATCNVFFNRLPRAFDQPRRRRAHGYRDRDDCRIGALSVERADLALSNRFQDAHRAD
jgi:hypothetical protein